jgi:hypothetical protein
MKKIIAESSTASLTFDIRQVPAYERDQLYHCLLGAVKQFFEDPVHQQEYEAWKAARAAGGNGGVA